MCLNILGWVFGTAAAHLQYCTWSSAHLQQPKETALGTGELLLQPLLCASPVTSQARRQTRWGKTQKSRVSLPRAWSQRAKKNLAKASPRLNLLLQLPSSTAAPHMLGTRNCRWETCSSFENWSWSKHWINSALEENVNLFKQVDDSTDMRMEVSLCLQALGKIPNLCLVTSVLKDIWHSGLSIYHI